MVHRTRLGLAGICGCVLLIVGCAPNWEEIRQAQERELRAHEAWTNNVAPLLSPPSGNAGEAAHVAYQVRLAYIGQTLEQMKPETLQTILAYAKSRDDRLYQALSLSLNNPLTNAMAQKWARSGNSGGNKFVFGGNDSENSFSNFDFTTGNQSPFITGSDNMTAMDGGQNIDGTGNTTGRTISRPLTQSDLQFAGDGGSGDDSPGGASDNNIDSEGLGFDGSL